MSNRVTAKANIVTKDVPTVTNDIMNDMLNNEILENVVCREDVVVTQASSTTNITVDFTGKDRINLSRTGGPLNITVSGLLDGETKWLFITKNAGQAITFVTVIDVTPVKPVVSSQAYVIYMIVRKGSQYRALALLETIIQATTAQMGIGEIATQAENNALADVTKFCVPGYLPRATQSQDGIVRLAGLYDAGQTEAATPDMVSYRVADAVATIKISEAWINATRGLDYQSHDQLSYFKDNTGIVHFKCVNLRPVTTIGRPGLSLVAALPVGYRQGTSIIAFQVNGKLGSGFPPSDSFINVGYVKDNNVYITSFPTVMNANTYMDFYIIFRAES
jgi:hypothetical protein